MKDYSIVIEAVMKVKNNDKIAMNLLYIKYVKEMITVSYRITDNLNDAEDVVQESFLVSFQKINQLKNPAHYSTWLKRTVINNSIKIVKGKLFFKELLDDKFEDNHDEGNWYENITFETINNMIQNLPIKSVYHN